MLFHQFLPTLLLLLFNVDDAPALKLPTFTFGGDRPAVIGEVKAQTGDSVVYQFLGCGNKKWKSWTTTRNETTGQPQLVDKQVVVGCNHDQTYSGNVVGATGTSCQTAVSCSDGTCSDVVADTSKPKYIFLDPHCFVDANDNNKLQSRWGNYEKTMKELRNKNPHGANVTTDDIYVAMPTKEKDTGLRVAAKKFLAHMWMAGPLAPNNRAEKIRCKDGCRYGTHLQIAYKQKEKAMHVFLQPHCDWFTVCTAWREADGTCNWQSTVNVMLRGGFVSFDSRKEQTPVRLLRKAKDNNDDVVVRVDVSVLSSETVGSKEAQLAVTTMFRQRVLGRINLGDNMMMSFSRPDCLHPDFGLRAQTGEVFVVPLKTDPQSYIEEVNKRNKDNLELDPKNDPQTNDAKGDVVPDPVTPPPIAPEVEDVTAEITTTTAVPQPVTANYIGVKPVNPEDAMADRSGHATWAVFYGWLLGSFVAFAVMGPVMYFCRRTLYVDWYRGMYKRYGCDASGTTGGITQTSFGDTITEASDKETVNSTMEPSSSTSSAYSSMSTSTGYSTQGTTTGRASNETSHSNRGRPSVTM